MEYGEQEMCIINNSGKYQYLREKREEMPLKETKKEWAKEGREEPGGKGITNAKGKETVVNGSNSAVK